MRDVRRSATAMRTGWFLEKPGLTCLRLGERISSSIESVFSMFRPSHLLSVALIAATAFGAVVPGVSVCEANVDERGSNPCCGVCCANSNTVSRTCCSKAVQASTCRCSVDHERPAVPQGQRNSDERDCACRSDCVLSVVITPDVRPTTRLLEDACHFTSLPTLRHLAVLCRWQT
jgi:hypothetical protein